MLEESVSALRSTTSTWTPSCPSPSGGWTSPLPVSRLVLEPHGSNKGRDLRYSEKISFSFSSLLFTKLMNKLGIGNRKWLLCSRHVLYMHSVILSILTTQCKESTHHVVCNKCSLARSMYQLILNYSVSEFNEY